MKAENIIIMPDIHGRIFWKEVVKDDVENKLYIFLGDYVDPYFHENIESKQVISNFKEILEFKKSHMDNVILLLGNHDCSYRYNTDICYCRYDEKNAKEISSLFNDNKELFQMAYELTIDGIHYIFSHGGIHKSYAELLFGEENVNENNVVEKINELYKKEDSDLISSLQMVSFIRGGWNKYGSIVWATIQEFTFGDDDEADDYEYKATQIFGHTQLRDTGSMIKSNGRFIDIDSRKIFTLQEIMDYKMNK